MNVSGQLAGRKTKPTQCVFNRNKKQRTLIERIIIATFYGNQCVAYLTTKCFFFYLIGVYLNV